MTLAVPDGLWWADLPAPIPRPALSGRVEADVAVVGAGYTGLWTAHYLLARDPGLRVVLLDAGLAGSGASGRNGGWCSALFPMALSRVASTSSPQAARALQEALIDTVDEVGRAAAAGGIDIDWAKGGSLSLARGPAQLDRAMAEVHAWREAGLDPEDLVLLGARETRERVRAEGVLGATFTPHCAAIHPAKLARGLVEVVQRQGAVLHEGSAVRSLEPGAVRTDAGEVRARFVVRATESGTASLPGFRRAILPVYSLMLATEPLDPRTWEQIGLARRETFTDGRHVIIYGQRTADGRLAFGGRGAPYHFRSRTRPAFEQVAKVHEALATSLGHLFPALAGVPIGHRWGGSLGIPRDWFPSVGLDRATGVAWAGGYVGDGVAATNLAGRTLADLITGTDSPLTRLPWVNHRSRSWEPEPLRWLEVNAGVAIMSSADAKETRTGRPARRAEWFGRFIGH